MMMKTYLFKLYQSNDLINDYFKINSVKLNFFYLLILIKSDVKLVIEELWKDECPPIVI